ncbi:hypothetical protein POPTR_014G104750v4 [Populus trichocarpa]|uniref:Uncharacterized protein n=1 Tax=Populus trichocarpa TaxID=3694 RepID=A0ACC0RYK3_POPTR|nr:hypothetical protein POPTR_014G104750v4 [Populus trichocarpa]
MSYATRCVGFLFLVRALLAKVSREDRYPSDHLSARTSSRCYSEYMLILLRFSISLLVVGASAGISSWQKRDFTTRICYRIFFSPLKARSGLGVRRLINC